MDIYLQKLPTKYKHIKSSNKFKKYFIMTKWLLSQECKVSSILEKSNNVIYHIKRVKKTMIDHLRGHRKNKFDKIQHLFTIKKTQQME